MNMQQEKTRRNLPPLFPEGMTAEAFPAWRQERLALYARACGGGTPPPPTAMRPAIPAGRADARALRRLHLLYALCDGRLSAHRGGRGPRVRHGGVLL